MSGSFTNLIYDKEAYEEQVKRSTNPLKYRLDPNYYISANPCFSEYGPYNGFTSSIAAGNQIDVDSVLRGITKVNSKANNMQMPDSIDHFKTVMPKNCPNILETQYSRYTHPAYEVRGLNTSDMHFSYPLRDPQCHIFEDFGINTRLQAKDNHRAIWQDPIDQRNFFPSEKKNNNKNCKIQLKCDYSS